MDAGWWGEKAPGQAGKCGDVLFEGDVVGDVAGGDFIGSGLDRPAQDRGPFGFQLCTRGRIRSGHSWLMKLDFGAFIIGDIAQPVANGGGQAVPSLRDQRPKWSGRAEYRGQHGPFLQSHGVERHDRHGAIVVGQRRCGRRLQARHLWGQASGLILQFDQQRHSDPSIKGQVSRSASGSFRHNPSA